MLPLFYNFVVQILIYREDSLFGFRGTFEKVPL